jgi:ribosomal protein S18 acetylase RimI-like enzyme
MIVVRRAIEQDFPAILKVQREAFSAYLNVYEVSAWTTETLESITLDAKDKALLVAESEGTVVGSVRFWTVAGVCVIRLLSVSPAYQGRGIAKLLMKEVERMAVEAHKLYLCTMLRTPRNIGLFLSLGYRPESLLPNHYNKLDLICFSKYREPAPRP